MIAKRICIAIALGLAALSTAACGSRIKYGEAAVEIRETGSKAGVQEQEITTGRYWNHPWSYRYIVKFPTTLQTYSWNNPAENCFSFINKDKVTTTACLSMDVVINPDQADNIVRKYRGAITKGGGEDGYVLDDVINGPVARRIQNYLNYSGNQFTAEQLYGDGGRGLAELVQKQLQAEFNRDGINIQRLQWARPPALPPAIVASIQGALQAQTDASRARAELARTVAEGDKQKAQADADAYVISAQARAIRENPAILELRAIENGLNICPPGVTTCVIGGNASQIIGEASQARAARNARNTRNQ